MKKLANRALIAVLCFCFLIPKAFAARLIPIGEVIGLELANGTVSVAAFDDSLGNGARQAGLQIGDCIVEMDGTPINRAEDVRTVLNRSDGQISVTVLRDNTSHKLTLRPQMTDHGPRLGVSLRQGVTGIGTVTWYDPENHTFGALGHGVSDSKGKLVEMTSGTAYRASVLSVKPGKCGEPGQLRGGLDSARPIGTLKKNTEQGIFGTADTGWHGTPLETCASCEVRTGSATVLSTVNGEQAREYSVEILRVYPAAQSQGRNMLLKITDQALLSTTGGIVQGMSGSPIIQEGKLVGAVTHVLVNDPTTGYGIFIENMLDAAA